MSEPQELQYLPAPERPTNFDRDLERIVLKCPTGETYVRFSWAMDIKETLNGVDIFRYPDIYNDPPKYVGMPFWMMEGWQSPDVYDPVEWEENKDVLGEFPRNGVWDFIAVLRDEQYNFVHLGERALKMAREWRFWRSKKRTRVIADLIAQREKLRAREESLAAERSQKVREEFRSDFIHALETGETNKAFSLPAPANYQHSKGGILIPK